VVRSTRFARRSARAACAAAPGTKNRAMPRPPGSNPRSLSIIRYGRGAAGDAGVPDLGGAAPGVAPRGVVAWGAVPGAGAAPAAGA